MTKNMLYLALGDSMSIDDYTGVAGGGAVNQFYQQLEQRDPAWELDDQTVDGCRMPDVSRDTQGDLITLTIGGNDLLWNRQQYLESGLSLFADQHRTLLSQIRRVNPDARFLVGDVYHPDAELSSEEETALREANRLIHTNITAVGAHLVPIAERFRGHESEYLCLQIEPTLAGAAAIARLFLEIYETTLNS